MQRLYEQFRGDGLEIVAVDLRESREQVSNFVEEYNLTFPVLLDTDGSVGSVYGARSIPTTYLIDRDGEMFAKRVGALEWDTPDMIEVLGEILRDGLNYESIAKVKVGQAE